MASLLRNASAVLLLLGVASAGGCATHFSIAYIGIAEAQSQEADRPVHAYPDLPERPEVGPFFVVYFLTPTDLAAETPKHTHHLYYQLLPCSQDSHGYSLFSGTVYQATQDEWSKFLGARSDDGYLYRIYVPIDAKRIAKNVQGFGDLDSARYLERAKKDSLCLKVGGGEMWGVDSMFSNPARLPLRYRDDSLVTE